MEQHLLTPLETAEYLKVNHATIVNWRRSGAGPRYITMGPRLIRYRRGDLDAWLDSQAKDSAA